MSEALAVLLELKDCSDYWSEYSVPIGIHERIDGAIAELLAQPDITTQYLLDQVGRLTAENAMLKEKWSAPKRKPLSDEEIQILYDRHAFAMESDEYMWGFRDAEKAHGIGGDDDNQ